MGYDWCAIEAGNLASLSRSCNISVPLAPTLPDPAFDPLIASALQGIRRAVRVHSVHCNQKEGKPIAPRLHPLRRASAAPRWPSVPPAPQFCAGLGLRGTRKRPRPLSFKFLTLFGQLESGIPASAGRCERVASARSDEPATEPAISGSQRRPARAVGRPQPAGHAGAGRWRASRAVSSPQASPARAGRPGSEPPGSPDRPGTRTPRRSRSAARWGRAILRASRPQSEPRAQT
jgi:hypothetical protein